MRKIHKTELDRRFRLGTPSPQTMQTTRTGFFCHESSQRAQRNYFHREPGELREPNLESVVIAAIRDKIQFGVRNAEFGVGEISIAV
jgi:hypothetical protein